MMGGVRESPAAGANRAACTPIPRRKLGGRTTVEANGRAMVRDLLETSAPVEESVRGDEAAPERGRGTRGGVEEENILRRLAIRAHDRAMARAVVEAVYSVLRLGENRPRLIFFKARAIIQQVLERIFSPSAR
jgi:hypothetical protein